VKCSGQLSYAGAAAQFRVARRVGERGVIPPL
jgi:hypothetical protein